jgi:hypothetical protein
MSAWRRLLEEESEHQWLSFAVFTFFIIIGAVLIDWSSELPGVHDGGKLSAEGTIYDSAGDAFLYKAENGMHVSLNGNSQQAPFATCLVQHMEITFACQGHEGIIWFSEEDTVELGWLPMSLGSSITASQLSLNSRNQMLIITEEGASNSLAAMDLGGNASSTTNLEGNMHLEAVTTTEDGWLVGGSWQAPSNWLGSDQTQVPLMFELVISVQWDGINAPSTKIVHMGDQGKIHGIFATDDGYIATGTSDTIAITKGVATSLGMSSTAAVGDLNGDVWLFGGVGSTTVAIISDDEVSIEKLPSRLEITPIYASCDDKGLISIYGVDADYQPGALSIDSEVRNSFTSLRGLVDLGFLLVSILILGMMGWNVSDAIRKGEVF